MKLNSIKIRRPSLGATPFAQSRLPQSAIISRGSGSWLTDKRYCIGRGFRAPPGLGRCRSRSPDPLRGLRCGKSCQAIRSGPSGLSCGSNGSRLSSLWRRAWDHWRWPGSAAVVSSHLTSNSRTPKFGKKLRRAWSCDQLCTTS
jgi:hypothetical protein